ncbi:transcriptional coactivator/pterin dehydratase [Daldinia caldariorum]|uniref:transcriptional coactivator/pterin dehydratase n=1 Tax=Daldinia caldariorum TaxID=326644 RepID=UPI002008D90A|nr:transcriptional coactivator/pterin dehydratase [Daldinia caldariorum]KAI1468792.1 transcriptional coactivator/pterin dehydratase [Daldinia caldariorum]
MYNRYARTLLYRARTTVNTSPPQLASKPVGAIRRGAQAVVTSRPRSLVYHHDHDHDQGQGQGQGHRTFAVSASATTVPKAETMADPAGPQAVVTPKFSAGIDEAALTPTLEPLLASARRGGRWVLTASGEGLERSFRFKTFAKTWDFMTAVSLQCKLKNHHPEWSNVYNTAYIRWTTHYPQGISEKDVELAAICDGLASDFSEIVEEPGAGNTCELKRVVDHAVTSAGDCCTPAKK